MTPTIIAELHIVSVAVFDKDKLRFFVVIIHKFSSHRNNSRRQGDCLSSVSMY
jgi:hypothetical protein